MPDSDSQIPGRWSREKRDWGVTIWVSFLTACAGTFILFALMDPERMRDDWVLNWEIGIRLMYGLGFLFLFIVSLLASKLTAWMIRTGPRRGHASGSGRRPPPKVRDPAELNPDLRDEDWE